MGFSEKMYVFAQKQQLTLNNKFENIHDSSKGTFKFIQFMKERKKQNKRSIFNYSCARNGS